MDFPGLEIVGLGKQLPALCVTNDMIAAQTDTSDAWIRSRSGIGTRYFCREETQLDLAAGAASRAIADAGIRAEEISLCIVATATPDYVTPAAAAMLQRRLGLSERIPAFDLNAACSGFLYGLQTAHSMLLGERLAGGGRQTERYVQPAGRGRQTERYAPPAGRDGQTERYAPPAGRSGQTDRYALLVGAERMSGIIDPAERSTYVLFGDGAGAAVLRLSERHRFRCVLGARGDDRILYAPQHGQPEPYLHMDGRAVFRFAVESIDDGITHLEEAAGIPAAEADYIVCHQANRRIIEHVQRQRKLRPEQFYMNLQRYGNTSAASIPLALADMREEGLLTPGTKVFLLGFGAGLTRGAAYVEF